MYDYNEACPISMAASVLCKRWTLQIIRELFFGSSRYSEIQRFIPNISPSLLRNRLRYLEERGLIVRRCPTRASHYEYFLTPSGKALAPVLTEMGKWGMRWARDGMTDKQNTAWGLVRDFAGGIDIDGSSLFRSRFNRIKKFCWPMHSELVRAQRAIHTE